ncbi:transcription repressor [Halobacterium salinarum NRC-1]|uniref:Transcription repressor n=5 Tax=Halobacterium salinarum TaxID=2242 RepID=Q9HRU8_HALSA|nr:transcription repressor [Halobacterium salinarum NRC-1]
MHLNDGVGMLSDVMEDYLKSIYNLEREHEPPIATSTIAEYLDVTPPTVTSMAEKLESRGLIEREKYAGVELTPDGETVAVEVIRHHRLLESFLATHLDYDWDEVHDEADALEHHISEEFEDRLAEKLGDPTVDPHGDPIPNADLEPPEHPDTEVLADHAEGDALVVARASDRNTDELRYLADAGVQPGTELTVTEHAPIGLFVVEIDGEAVHLPERVAETLEVRPAADEVTDA